jgi:hypothetical protein
MIILSEMLLENVYCFVYIKEKKKYFFNYYLMERDKEKEKKKEKELKVELKHDSTLGGDRIVLRHEADIEHLSPYLPKGFLCIVINGMSGCGKTHLMLSFLPNIARLKYVFICSLIQGNPVYEQIKNWCEDTDRVFGMSTVPATAKQSLEEMIQEKDPDDWGICIFDDFTQGSNLRTDPYNQCMFMVSSMLRNYKFHSMYITQASQNVLTLTRTNRNVFVTFLQQTKSAKDTAKKDFVGSGLCTSEQFDQLYDMMHSAKHSYLMMVSSGDTNKLYAFIPGKTGNVAEEVEFNVNEDDILKDDFIISKIKTMKSSLSVLQKRRAYQDIIDYLQFKANKGRLNPDSCIEKIDEALGCSKYSNEKK